AAARFGTVRWRHESVVRAGQFSPDGKLIWTDSEDGSVRAWDARTGRQVDRPAELAHCWQLRLSADGDLLAGLRHREAIVYSRKASKNLLVISSKDYVGGFALSPDGSTLVLGDTTHLSGEENRI